MSRPKTPPPPAKRSGDGIDRRLLAGLIGIAALATAVVALVVVGAFEDVDDPERSAARTTSAPATPTATHSPATSPEPEPTAEARTPPARATVQGTCGRDGLGGDCILRLTSSTSRRPAATSRPEAGSGSASRAARSVA